MSETSALSQMYHMKPVFCLPTKLPRAKVMYDMKNIHDHGRIATLIEQQVTSLLKVQFFCLKARKFGNQKGGRAFFSRGYSHVGPFWPFVC